MQDSPLGTRITVWRPFSPGKPLTLHDPASDKVSVFGPDDCFQTEAFVWHAREDLVGGIVEPSARQELNDRLMNNFQPVLPPQERNIAKLRTFLASIVAVLDGVDWSDSAQQMESDNTNAVHINSLLAFYQQLTWICDVFDELPGASVSIQ